MPPEHTYALAFDVYPPEDPAGKISGYGDAAAVARLTLDDQLVDGEYVAELFGTGSGFVEIHIDHPDAEFLVKRAYVKVIKPIDEFGVEAEIGGFFLERASFNALSKSEQKGRTVKWEGQGPAFGLDRYHLGHSIYAPGQDHRGSIDVPGKWHWNDQPYGSMLVRMLEEGFNHPAAFYGFYTWDFTRAEDSNGNDWDEITDYEIPIGTNGLKLFGDFLRLGLVAEVDPDLVVHAYRDLDEYRTDRHSATFAAGKVRFEAGINILNDLPKRIDASAQRTHVLIEDRIGDYQTIDEDLTSTPIDGVPYMTFLKSTTTADDGAIVKMGQLHLTRRDQYTDLAKVTHLVGPGEEDGAEGYLPAPGFGSYWLGDLVTVHTGTTEHDFNEQTIEVAAVRYHVIGNDWMVEAELGAQYRNISQQQFQAQVAQTIVNQIGGVELCQPSATVVDSFFVGEVEVAGGTLDNSDLPSGAAVDDYVVVTLSNVSLAAIPAGGSGFTLMGTGGTTNGGPGDDIGYRTAYRKLTSGDLVSGSWAFTDTERIVGGVYRGISAVQNLTGASIDSGGASSSVGQIPAATITDGPSIVFGSLHSNIDTTIDDDVSGMTRRAHVSSGGGAAAAFDTGIAVASYAGGTTALSPASAWQGHAVELVVGEQLLVGDGLVDLVGTSSKAKRCDDTEHYHATGSDAPTVDDDAAHGFRLHTVWINDDGEAWLLIDTTAGAADWLAFGGGGGGGGTPTFVGAKAYSTGTQNISSGGAGTAVAVTFGSEEFDTDGFHSTSSNTSRMTVPSGKAGKYLVQGMAFFQANSAGIRYGFIRKTASGGGTTELRGSATRTLSPGNTGGISVQPQAIVDLAVGDYVELMVEQNSGSTLTVGHASILPIQSMLELTLLGT